MTDDEPIGVALVGAGAIAAYHLDGLAATGRAAVRAVVARRRARAEETAARFGAESGTDDLSSVLARADVAALVIATPDDTHEAIATSALRAGKAVLLQKPMAGTTAGCRRILGVALETGVDLQVSFMHRYFDEVVQARALIAAGAIGTVTSARMRNATPGPDWADWFFDADRVGGGVVAQLGVHGIDLLAHALGPIRTVSARLATLVPERTLADGRTVPVGNPDSALASYAFESGALASHEMSMVETAGCDRFRLEIYGTEGTLWLRTERGRLACFTRSAGEWSTPALGDAPLGAVHHDRWLDGLAGREPPESTATEALAGMLVAEAIERSAHEGSRSVEVGEI